MEVLIIILVLIAILVALVGIVGAIVPAIPGPPLCFASMAIAYFTSPGYISGTLLAVMFVVTIIVTILDYVAPIWLTKLGGGSRLAMWGSTLGVFAGLFFAPWGLILGPLVGAFIGEMMNESNTGKAFRVALMSFVAFLLTSGLKLVVCLLMTFYCFKAFIDQGSDIIMKCFE